MRYAESFAQSAECLRMALQYMARHGAGLHPVSYAVWYEYAAGINPGLTAEINALTARGTRLDDDGIYALHRKYIADIDEEAVQRLSNSVQRIVSDVSRSATSAGDRASRFGDVLDQWSAALVESLPPGQAPLKVDSLLRDTREMQQAIGQLRSKLEDSTREAERLKQEVARARAEAKVDGLTGLANRKAFDHALAVCLASVSADQPGPCLLMVDIDHFKRINDGYGHMFGDKVLRGVGRIMDSTVQDRGTAARYGGEEFALLLPRIALADALDLAEALRLAVARNCVKRVGGPEAIGDVTVSIGVARFRPGESGEGFVERADRALYASKAKGRNCVTVADDILAFQG